MRRQRIFWQIAVYRLVRAKGILFIRSQGANGEYFFCFPLNDPLGKNSCPVARAGQANGAAFNVFT